MVRLGPTKALLFLASRFLFSVSDEQHQQQHQGRPERHKGRRSAWRYEHTVEKQAAAFLVVLGLRGVDTQADRVWVFFDEEDNVLHVGTLFQASEAEYDVPVF